MYIEMDKDGRPHVDALLGWCALRLPSGRGMVLELQHAHGQPAAGVEPASLHLTLSENQARLLGTYLVRMAGDEPAPPTGRLRRWFGL